MTKHSESTDRTAEPPITLRSAAELADALPYLLGFHPTDSLVLVALHGPRGRFGGRLRLGIPAAEHEWADAARQVAECLVSGAEQRGGRPDGVIAFLCRDPGTGETGRDVVERLRPLAQRLRTACGALDVPVLEALCVSGARFWSYCCSNTACCPAEGSPMAPPGTSVMAAAATYAGIQVRGTLRELETGLTPLGGDTAKQEHALDAAGARMVPRILDGEGRAAVSRDTIALAARLLDRFRDAVPVSDPVLADGRDDALLSDTEAAELVMGLQDRETRDRAAQWMEGPEAGPALRLWRALARRCVGPYVTHAAAPLALAGWVAWSTGDEVAARVALGMALSTDPDYLFAQLLHHACNEGLDPESVRRCLRREPAGAEEQGPQGVPAAGEPATAPAALPGAGSAARDAGSAAAPPRGGPAAPRRGGAGERDDVCRPAGRTRKAGGRRRGGRRESRSEA
ncbi:DUF4192 domain-containing protein [Streptomyces sp. GC420]|uniref:DUF4192 domain-containing protein n=1 Tax=Streptomyces sp. GC420 TaxID=2697568 RepID=UPI00141517E9|nr:DUF4192 domain-containing protein [Streptomyces sp. GC420]NBM14152.1 DUF4192 family protein [Streptomyces sp. GC420]